MQGGTSKPVLEGNDILEQKGQPILNIDASPSGTRAGRRTLRKLMVCGYWYSTASGGLAKHREHELRLRSTLRRSSAAGLPLPLDGVLCARSPMCSG